MSNAIVNRWEATIRESMHCECGKESHHREAEAALEILANTARGAVSAGGISTTFTVLESARSLANATDNASRNAALGDLYNAVESHRATQIQKALRVACDEEIPEGEALERICRILERS